MKNTFLRTKICKVVDGEYEIVYQIPLREFMAIISDYFIKAEIMGFTLYFVTFNNIKKEKVGLLKTDFSVGGATQI